VLHPFDKGFTVGMMYVSVFAATDCDFTLTVNWKAIKSGHRHELQQSATRTATADSRSAANATNLSNQATGYLDASSGSHGEQHGAFEDQSPEGEKLAPESNASAEGGEKAEQVQGEGQGEGGEAHGGNHESAAYDSAAVNNDGVADGQHVRDEVQQEEQDGQGVKGLDEADGEARHGSPGADETRAGVNVEKKDSKEARNGSKQERNGRSSGTPIKLVHAKTTEELRGMDWQGVCVWLTALDISEKVINKVTEEKVPGEQLRAMSVDEMKLDLGMSSLQAKRVAMNMLQ
jgi:hypothetical protein